MNNSYESVFKIIIVGDSGVGKTNIMTKYIKNEFSEKFKVTIGVDFFSKEFDIEGHKIKAQIFDTAGQERFRSLIVNYYKGAKGAFIVYDITSENSFNAIDNWVSNIRAFADKKIILILIGNKSDLEKIRKVSKEKGEEKAKGLGLAFLETSALNGENLEKAFELMINEIYKKGKEDKITNAQNANIEPGKNISTLDKSKENVEKKKCC